MAKKYRKERAPSYTLRKTGFTKVGAKELITWGTTGNKKPKSVSTTNLVIVNLILFGLIIFLTLI